MKIVHIEELDDGNVLATVADNNDNIVGVNIYGPESRPRPKIGEIVEGGIIRRFWYWLTASGQDTPV